LDTVTDYDRFNKNDQQNYTFFSS